MFQIQPTQDQGETGSSGPFKVLISAWTQTLLENMIPQQTGRGLVRMVLAFPATSRLLSSPLHGTSDISVSIPFSIVSASPNKRTDRAKEF